MFNVVIADDEPLILKNLQSIIPWGELDCRVVGTGKNGKEAYSLCEKYGADLVLTDISMPGMTGLELLKKLESLPKSPLTIMISGYDYFEYAREALHHKAFDYILKPVDYDDLRQCIERAISKRKENCRTEYEVEKLRLHEWFTQGSVSLKSSRVFTPLIPILINNVGSNTLPELHMIKYVYFLSAGYTFLLTEWPDGDMDCLIEVFQDWNRGLDKFILIGKRVENEESLKPSLEELRKWVGVQHLVNQEVVLMEELKEKYLTKKSAVDSIEEVKSYIHDHYQEDLSTELAAEQANMSVSYFSLLFKQVSGSTFLEYLTQYRMGQAAFLLVQTNLKTSEIAERVGYYDPKYFRSVFRKRMDVTPNEYRKLHSLE